MRKLKLQVQVTSNGFMNGPNGEMDWMTLPWSDDMAAYSSAAHESVDCIVLARPLAEGFIPAWESRRDDPQGEEPETIEWMINTPKVVFSKTVTELPWDNVTVVGGDVPALVNELKARPGGDLITYGGGAFTSELVANGLVDDLYMYVNPTLIGSGVSVFGGLNPTTKLSLADARAFDCGITVLHYQPAAD